MRQGMNYPVDFSFPEIDMDRINSLIQEALDVYDGEPGRSCRVSEGDLSVEWNEDLRMVRVWRLVATAHYTEGGHIDK